MKRAKENLKSLIMLLLTVSMIFLAVKVVSVNLTGESTGAVDISSHSLLSALGLDFLSPLFEKKQKTTDFDASDLLYPTYAVVENRYVHEKTQLSKIFNAYEALLAKALLQSGSHFGGDLNALTQESGSLFLYFSNPVTSDLFVRLFGEQLPARVFSFRTVLFTPTQIYFAGGDDTYILPIQKEDEPLYYALMQAASDMSGGEAVLTRDSFNRASGFTEKDALYTPFTLSTKLYDTETDSFDAILTNEVASVFGFHSSITEENGLLYVGNNSNLSISKQGRLHLSASRTGGGIALAKSYTADVEHGFSQKQVLAVAEEVLQKLADYMGEVRLSRVEYVENTSSYLLHFSFVHDGYDVVWEESDAAVFTYQNGYFTDISISLLSYTEKEKVPAENLKALRTSDVAPKVLWVDGFYQMLEGTAVFSYRFITD